jgi:hypothetical protein
MQRAVLFAAALMGMPAVAQDRIPSHCIALAQGVPGVDVIRKASFGAPLAEGRVRITYVDHATFLIETPGGLVAATDYTGYLGTSDVVPDVVTMNNAHGTHWTDSPDPRIRIKSLELLGKISDVGLFTDRTEITITHQTTDELRNKLRAKLQRLVAQPEIQDAEVVISGEIIDVDAELGLETPKTAEKADILAENTPFDDDVDPS